MPGDVFQAQRLGILDQEPDDAAALGHLPDAPDGLVVDPLVDEL